MASPKREAIYIFIGDSSETVKIKSRRFSLCYVSKDPLKYTYHSKSILLTITEEISTTF